MRDCEVDFFHVGLFKKESSSADFVNIGISEDEMAAFYKYMEENGFSIYKTNLRPFEAMFKGTSNIFNSLEEYTAEEIKTVVFKKVADYCKQNNLAASVALLVTGIESAFAYKGIVGIISNDTISTYVTDSYEYEEVEDALEAIADEITDNFYEPLLYSLEDEGVSEEEIDEDYTDESTFVVQNEFSWAMVFEWQHPES